MTQHPDRLLTPDERAALLNEHREAVRRSRVVIVDDRPCIAPGKFLAWAVIGTALWLVILVVIAAAMATIRTWRPSGHGDHQDMVNFTRRLPHPWAGIPNSQPSRSPQG